MVAAPAGCDTDVVPQQQMNPCIGSISNSSSPSPHKPIKNFKNYLTVDYVLLNNYVAVNYII